MMGILGTLCARGAIAVVALATLATGQSMSLSALRVFAGQSVSVNYSDPSSAGQTVYIEVDNGDPINPTIHIVPMKLDASGNGSASWHSPEGGWGTVANFNAPGVSQKTIAVRPAPPPQGGNTGSDPARGGDGSSAG